jgi:formate dehydrogenase subunit delta
MDTQKLISMANQIGSFFESYPDQDEAKKEVAVHLKKFWAPRMRKELLAYVESEQGKGLSATLLAALAAHRQIVEP